MYLLAKLTSFVEETASIKFRALLDVSFVPSAVCAINPLKPHCNGRSSVIATLAVDGWDVRFGSARRGLGARAAVPAESPPR